MDIFGTTLNVIYIVIKNSSTVCPQGIEVFSTDGSHMYLIFNSPKERDLFYEQIVRQPGK